MMIPVINTKNSAPDELLKMVQCTWPETNKTLRCCCQKTGLLCPQLWEYCGGQSYSNFLFNTVVDSTEIQAEERDEDDENISKNEFLDIVKELDPPEDIHYEECDQIEHEYFIKIEYSFESM
ncbi:hypothetical protein M0804_014767 [Polistes exclamans]|nr:hypothetical protein M0804_014767 [Polistes exclamans]